MAGEVGIQSVPSPFMDRINFRRPKKMPAAMGWHRKFDLKITGGAGPRDHGSYALPL
jgi:hypothetical protein